MRLNALATSNEMAANDSVGAWLDAKFRNASMSWSILTATQSTSNRRKA